MLAMQESIADSRFTIAENRRVSAIRAFAVSRFTFHVSRLTIHQY
jgi:hypothetical protein